MTQEWQNSIATASSEYPVLKEITKRPNTSIYHDSAVSNLELEDIINDEDIENNSTLDEEEYFDTMPSNKSNAKKQSFASTQEFVNRKMIREDFEALSCLDNISFAQLSGGSINAYITYVNNTKE
jgi:hypothetical protein